MTDPVPRERIKAEQLACDIEYVKFLGHSASETLMLLAGYIGNLRALLAQREADKATIEEMRKDAKTIRRDAFNEIASIAEALASQQGIKSELAATLRECIDADT